ncbi:hypothetical protein OESDEN_20827 [Oesophagostomum dentatum]|uniref:ET module n=1 Tax=Oesophagostomum dentatum TaxID=61180 RepID=A0A0B1S3M7_OESDE|nr:hypothetical protein OESDEN_20827 [Oesophagostomum dentatum]
MSTFRPILVFAAPAATTFALKCYDGDSVHGRVKLVECPEYEFCAWIERKLVKIQAWYGCGNNSYCEMAGCKEHLDAFLLCCCRTDMCNRPVTTKSPTFSRATSTLA